MKTFTFMAIGMSLLGSQLASATCTSKQVDDAVVKHKPKFLKCHRGIPLHSASFGQFDIWEQQVSCGNTTYTLELSMTLSAKEGDCRHPFLSMLWYRESRH